MQAPDVVLFGILKGILEKLRRARGAISVLDEFEAVRLACEGLAQSATPEALNGGGTKYRNLAV
jgi:hypothetical protein